MKHLVVYSSKSGNTKKLADAIFSRLPEPKDISSVQNAPDPSGYDVIAAGFFFQAGQADPEAQKFLKKCKRIPKLFLFATHGATKTSEHAKIGMNKARELATESNVIGTFSCQGEVSDQTMESAKNKNPQPEWVHDAEGAKGHPDNDDLYELSESLAKAGLTEKPKQPEGRMFS